jgi:hypothetical protein
MSMASKVRYKTFEQLSFADMLVFSKLPAHPLWSRIETKINFSFADELCAVLYSGRGQHPYAPSLKLKVHLVQAYYNLTDRQTEEKIIGDLFIKRFLGLPVDFFGFDHSTIGLDRDRMGSFMFEACHLYILSQMCTLGLWGDKNESWIIDSFPSTARLAKVGAYRLIQMSMIRLMQHLKRTNRPLYVLTSQTPAMDAMTYRLPPGSTDQEWLPAFSKLVVHAYGLLSWLEQSPVFWAWKQKDAQLKSLELQALLMQIVMENTRPYNPEPSKPSGSKETDEQAAVPTELADRTVTERPGTTKDASAPTAASPIEVPEEEPLAYVKIPKKERAAHRIISAYDTDARRGAKNRFTVINGYKTQNLCTTGGVVLETKAIPGSEHDREAMAGMVRAVQSFFGITPKALLGDTAYGHGKQRRALQAFDVAVIAPVAPPSNPTGLYGPKRFTYDRDKDVYRCPQGNETVKKRSIPASEGHQYYFGSKACGACPLRSECTSNKEGRTVFHSDYYDEYEAAKAFNESEQGQAELRKRSTVERVNKELKTYCGLGEPRTKSLEALDRKAKLAGIITNLKLTVRRLCGSQQGFLRRPKKPEMQTV